MKIIKKQNKYCLLLSQSFLFNEIDHDIVSEAYYSEDCSCTEFESGEKIYTRNSFKKSIGIVLSGELKAFKPGAEGANLVLNTFLTGGVFGVAGLFNNTKQYVSEVVAVKRSRVLFLPQQLLHRLFEQNFQIAENYISYLSNRICFLNSRIDNFTGGSAETRLAAFILSLSAQNDNSLQFRLPCTLTQLSNTLDMGRASLYRAMDALSELGIIQKNGRVITIVNFDRLKSGLY